MKSATKPTNKKGLCVPLKNSLLDLGLDIEVKKLKNHMLVAGNPFQRSLSGILV